MRNPRSYMYSAAAGAVLLAGAVARSALQGEHLHAAMFGIGMLVLAEAALREHRRLRRRRLEAEWARSCALGENPPPLEPCCLLSFASDGRAHDRRCTGTHSLSQVIDNAEQQRSRP
ncbi:hypothetical protein ABZZ79_03375 [Streptomyces sp. NPDC006458]|uniref:hypothetical protein n=1 Tax=Streptomyces sp. NPDC006458 TaxID=3154302 RepID=UPI0033B6AD4D